MISASFPGCGDEITWNHAECQEFPAGGKLPDGRTMIAAFRPFLVRQTAFYVFTQDNRFGDFLHGFATLAALSLNRKISLLLGHSEFALENSLGTLHKFSRLQLFGKMQILAFQPRTLDFCSHPKTDGRN